MFGVLLANILFRTVQVLSRGPLSCIKLLTDCEEYHKMLCEFYYCLR